MEKFEDINFIRTFNQWGGKTNCGCVEFTFENNAWFASKIRILVLSLLVVVISVGLGLRSLEETKYIFQLLLLPAVFGLILFLKGLFCVKKETLYVMAPIGVQFITSFIIGKDSIWFVPWHSLQNFVIVEVIVGQQIFFYLGLQNRTCNTDNDNLVILFQNTRPRLCILEDMYRDIVNLFLSKKWNSCNS